MINFDDRSNLVFLNPFSRRNEQYILNTAVQDSLDTTTVKSFFWKVGVIAAVTSVGALVTMGAVLPTLAFGAVALVNEGVKMGIDKMANDKIISQSSRLSLRTIANVAAVAAGVGICIAAGIIAPPLGIVVGLVAAAAFVALDVPYAVALFNMKV